MTTTRDLGVCRWELECPLPATQVVTHTELGDYPACDDHAGEHTRWATVEQHGTVIPGRGDRVRLVPRPEPRPECYCPTTPRRRVPYCPEHGTTVQRGIDPLADDT